MNNQVNPYRISHDSSANTNAENDVVDANNKFALNLYLKICNDPQYENSNFFFSPFSISSVLAISHEGARGNTADEIQSVFFFPDDNTERRQGFEQLYTDINQGNSTYTLKIANALWAEKTYPFLPDYIHTAQTYYKANATNLDFKNQADNSRVAINTWIEDQTNNMIKDVIQPGEINPSTRLLITNAVYFKGTWVVPFDKNRTKSDYFSAASGNTVSVPMMTTHLYDAIFGYMETDSLQVLELLYATDSMKQVSMLVLLPKGNTLKSIEKSLSVQTLSELRKRLIKQEVHVRFPKFKFETRYSLPDTLASMGMPTAFTDRADFSGMDGTKNLYIEDVIHRAFIDVNEEGTEATAATVGLPSIGKMTVFRANHPFIFLIQDNETGFILFMGRVNNLKEEQIVEMNEDSLKNVKIEGLDMEKIYF